MSNQGVVSIGSASERLKQATSPRFPTRIVKFGHIDPQGFPHLNDLPEQHAIMAVSVLALI
jgi:hypothetical protein